MTTVPFYHTGSAGGTPLASMPEAEDNGPVPLRNPVILPWPQS